MDRITDALGEDDEDVQNIKAGIAGLVFGGWSDEDIATGALEMARESRRELAASLEHAEPTERKP